MLFVERSNRTEALFDGLAARLGAPGRDPLARAVVVVQGAGMERWIAQRIARLHGVCANVEFPFPRPFLESVFEAVPGPAGDGGSAAAPWVLDRMAWAIAKRIDAGHDVEEYAPLVRHLDGPDGAWRLIQLAYRIADVFDQYITYRPDWVRSWEHGGVPTAAPAAGPDLGWQIRLFRELRAELGPGHMANRAADFLEALGLMPARKAAVPAGLERRAIAEGLRRRFPDAIEIFAVSTLPPLHLAVVRGMAALVDVRLSILSPSRAWYSDLWRELRDGEGGAEPPIAALLSGLGRLGADFQQTLEDAGPPDGGERELFVAPDGGRADASLLLRLQSRILDLDEEGPSAHARRVSRADDSIRVHLCHGPRRELEVVEGILRAAFERDPTLAPEDVIVMAPDIDAIAPDVEAVFGPAADERGGIPFRIADRGTYRRSPVAEAFRTLLALVGTRMARSAVFDWLALPDVSARFGLDEPGVLALCEWAERAGVRFGLDEMQRAALRLPSERRHTLAGGLDRLVLAHALGETRDVLRDLSPIGLDAFAEPAWIGALGEVATLLESAAREAGQARSVGEWTRWLGSLLARSVARIDANSHEHAAIDGVLERLRISAEATGFAREIPFEAIRERVVSTLEQSPSPQAFLAGGVTFCQLVPLRAIPFRIVVVTGLVDGDFPRSRAAVGFDLMAKTPRAGDRRLRDDDRHLFLEALLSAREQLVLTVPARDPRDGTARPPSIVVNELLDALEATFVLEDAGKLRDWLVVAHPLQASSPRYFERGRDPRLVSRSQRAHRGAVARRHVIEATDRPARRFLVPGALSSRASSVVRGPAEPILLDELIDRVLRSTRYFAREVLGLRLPRPEAAADDLDPVELTPLEQSELGRAVFEDLSDGVSWSVAARRLRAHPLLPAGSDGERLARSVSAEARVIAELAARCRSGERLPDLDFELVVPDPDGGPAATLVGRLDALFPDARVEAGFGRIGGSREAALWIRHLVLCALAARDGQLPRQSIGIGRPASRKDDARVVRLAAVDDPMPRLGWLVRWAASVDQAPLPFFERSSRKFADAVLEDQPDEAKAWRDARSEFEGSDDSGWRQAEGEQELETVRIWEGLSPIAEAAESGLPYGFDELARAFFEPLFRARKASRA